MDIFFYNPYALAIIPLAVVGIFSWFLLRLKSNKKLKVDIIEIQIINKEINLGLAYDSSNTAFTRSLMLKININFTNLSNIPKAINNLYAEVKYFDKTSNTKIKQTLLIEKFISVTDKTENVNKEVLITKQKEIDVPEVRFKFKYKENGKERKLNTIYVNNIVLGEI
jgi:hypothetical protein